MASTDMHPEVLPRISVDTTFGAAFIGNLGAAILYGFTCLQTYSFYQQQHGRCWFRTLILCLWALDTFHLVAISGALYFYLVSNSSNPIAILEPDLWAETGYYVTTGLMEFVIRGIFTYRVWKLSERNWPLTVTIVVMSLLNWVGNIVFTVKNFTIKTYPDLHSIAWLFYMAFGASVVADLITAISLFFLLKGRRTGFSNTDSFLKALMLYSVNTGALSSLCALLVLILYAASPHTFAYVTFYFILPKVMLNSLLATFNASKKQWERTHNTGSKPISIPMSARQYSSSRFAHGEAKHSDPREHRESSSMDASQDPPALMPKKYDSPPAVTSQLQMTSITESEELQDRVIDMKCGA